MAEHPGEGGKEQKKSGHKKPESSRKKRMVFRKPKVKHG